MTARSKIEASVAIYPRIKHTLMTQSPLPPLPPHTPHTPPPNTTIVQEVEANTDCTDLPSLQCGICDRVCAVGGIDYMVSEHGNPPWSIAMCACDPE